MKSRNLFKKAQAIEPLAAYLESADIPHDDLSVAKAARYQEEVLLYGESNRWDNATDEEIGSLRRFVRYNCRGLY